MEASSSRPPGGLSLPKLILIIVPLVTLFEVLRYLPVFRRAGNVVEPMMRGWGSRGTRRSPCSPGFFLASPTARGSSSALRSRKGSPPGLFLMGLFLATCHSVVEDILIFVVIGGTALAILGVRLGLAVFLTGLMARVWKPA